MSISLSATDERLNVVGDYLFEVEEWVIQEDIGGLPPYIRLINVEGYTRNLPGSPNHGTDFLMRRILTRELVTVGSIATYWGGGFTLEVVPNSSAPMVDPDYEAWCAEQQARGDMAGEPYDMKCFECAGFKGHDYFVMRKVEKLGPVVAKHFDATQTYYLECGHLVF